MATNQLKLTNASTNLNHHLKMFLNFMHVERGASSNTINAYQNDLSQFSNFLKLQNQPGFIHWEKVHAKHISEFMILLQDRGYSETSRSRKLASIKSFFSFLLNEGIIPEDTSLDLSSPRYSPTLPHNISVSSMNKLLELPKLAKPSDKMHLILRNHSMLELMYATGIRVSEMTNLNLKDLNISESYLRVIGKGNKERILPVYSEALSSVESWIQVGRVKILGNKFSNALFLNSRGNRLTRQGFWTILKRESERAGILEPVTPHTIRHSFATHLLQGGASLLHVQSLLGHSSISTTQIYTHLTDEHVRLEYHKAHPRA
ncbi:MAG: tyrosine recombinase [Chloroflexi bacterium]|nr:tyrosine recombinase [Chloroflexota bacterium]|tara:strand:+ start:11216 stop:12169 length:954 start_codon:yes stop_codon:yes gene_type:complete